MMEDWKRRLIEEYDQLEERIMKLRRFLNETPPTEVQGYDLMLCQYHAMQTYSQALHSRMKLYGMVKQ